MAQTKPGAVVNPLDRLPLTMLEGKNVSLLASAGTGKTTSLVHTVTLIFLLLPDLQPEEILLLTFTEKAAAEMRERLLSLWYTLYSISGSKKMDINAIRPLLSHPFTELLEQTLTRNTEKTRRRLEEMIHFSGRLTVSTIHSFCMSLLKEFSIEAGVDPDFDILDPSESAFVFEESFSRFLREQFEKSEGDPTWDHFFSLHGSVDTGAKALFELMKTAVLNQRDIFLLSEDAPDPDGGALLESLKLYALPHLDLLHRFVITSSPSNPEVREWFAGIDKSLGDLVATLRNGKIPSLGTLENVEKILNERSARGLNKKSDFPMSGESFPLLTADLESVKEVPVRCSFRELRDRSLDRISLLKKLVHGGSLEPFLSSKIRRLADIYEEEKGGSLDFLDLLVHAWTLLKKNGEVREEVRKRYRYLFVDEFQDTDPVQAYICRLIAGTGGERGPLRGGSLFIVGDPKQSIYRFRRADPQVYHSFHLSILQEGGVEEKLTRNFRSRPPLVQFVNSLFGRIFRVDTDYTFSYGHPLDSHRDETPNDPLCPVNLYTLDHDTDGTTFVARLIERILESPLRIPEGTSTREVKPGDIAVLYRADYGNRFVLPLKEKCEALGIPAVFSSMKGFYDRQEVLDIIHVVEAIVDPGSEFALYGALKSFLFGFTDTDLFDYFVGKSPPPPHLREALDLIDRFREMRDIVPPHSLLEDIFEQTGAHFTALASPEKERLFLILEKLLILARSFWERTRGTTRDFLKSLRKQAYFGAEEGELPSFEEGENAVKVMTIHGAKGLEFPVVIYYASGERKFSPGPLVYDRVRNIRGFAGGRFVSPACYQAVEDRIASGETRREEKIPLTLLEERKSRWEALRLAYVAMTRARDFLFIARNLPSPKGQKRENEELSVLEEMLAEGNEAPSRCPVTGVGGTTVSLEGLTLFSSSPITDEGDIPAKEKAFPPIPPLSVEEEKEPIPPVSITHAGIVLEEEAQRRFGTKVHQIFEIVSPFERDFKERALSLAHLHFTEEEEVSRFHILVETVSESRIREEFSGWEIVGKEVPLVTVKMGEPRRDAADTVLFREGACVVVDYKTGSPAKDQEEAYVAQVKHYASAVEKGSGCPTTGFIWFVEEDRGVWVPP